MYLLIMPIMFSGIGIQGIEDMMGMFDVYFYIGIVLLCLGSILLIVSYTIYMNIKLKKLLLLDKFN